MMVFSASASIIAVLALALLGGCLVLPIPIPPSGQSAEEVASLLVGTSTRKEVHDMLGPPNLLATPRHELWELERDPFHMFLIAELVGPGAGIGLEEPVYFGEHRPHRYRLAIAYDDVGNVRSWSLEGMQLDPNVEVRSSSQTMYAQSAPATEPLTLGRSRIWNAETYALSPGGRHAALVHYEEGRRRLEILDLARGRRIAESREWPEACGLSVMLGLDGEDILSLPFATGLLCRWRVTDGVLSAEPSSSPALADALEGRSTVRLLGRFVVASDGSSITVTDASARQTKTLPTEDRLSVANLALDAAGGVLAAALVTPQGSVRRVLLVDVAWGFQQILSLTALESILAVVLAPAGDLMALPAG